MQSVRAHKTRLFVDVNDGSGPTHTQLVIPMDVSNQSVSHDINKVRPGTYIRARGSTHPVPATNKNPWLREELHCTELAAIAPSDPSACVLAFIY